MTASSTYGFNLDPLEVTLVQTHSTNSAYTAAVATRLLGRKEVVGVFGSLATIRIPRLVIQFRNLSADVRSIVTSFGQHFVSAEETIHKIRHQIGKRRQMERLITLIWPGLPVILRKQDDILLNAPTLVDTLAKPISNFGDNSLTWVACAWPLQRTDEKPLLIVLAIHKYKWLHAITTTHLAFFAALGTIKVIPAFNILAYNDESLGAMKEISNTGRYFLEGLTQCSHPELWLNDVSIVTRAA